MIGETQPEMELLEVVAFIYHFSPKKVQCHRWVLCAVLNLFLVPRFLSMRNFTEKADLGQILPLSQFIFSKSNRLKRPNSQTVT